MRVCLGHMSHLQKKPTVVTDKLDFFINTFSQEIQRRQSHMHIVLGDPMHLFIEQ